MNKGVSLLILLVFCLGLKAKDLPGKMFTGTQMLNVMVIVPVSSLYEEINFAKLTQNPAIRDSLSDKKIRLDLEKVKEIRFEYQGKLIRLVSMPNSQLYSDTTSGYTLLELKVDGPMRFYYHYERRGNGHFNENGQWVTDPLVSKMDIEKGRVVVEKNNNSFLVKSPIVQWYNERPKRFFKGSKKRWILYCLNDCPELIGQVERKKIRVNVKKLELLVEKFNTLCGA
ncbi:MAG: hypothetical protein R3B47_01545 [Bacteroidia bacterium]